MIDIQSATVRLGDREYTISEAPRLRAKPWRERFITEMRPLLVQVGQVNDITFDTPEDLLKVVPLFELIFTRAADQIAEMVFAYSADLEAEREYIEAHATDRQLVAAFAEVARLSDPFGVVGQLQRGIGLRLIGTSSSLRAPNGAVSQAAPLD